MGVAEMRLTEERKSWRKDRPFGFTAKPTLNADNTSNYLHWECQIPAKKESLWYPGLFNLTMKFTEDYPAEPPKCTWHKIDGKPLFHPNVYESGKVCLSITNTKQEGGTWAAALTIRHVLLALQTFLDEPNPKSPAQAAANEAFVKDKAKYERTVKAQVAKVEVSGLV